MPKEGSLKRMVEKSPNPAGHVPIIVTEPPELSEESRSRRSLGGVSKSNRWGKIMLLAGALAALLLVLRFVAARSGATLDFLAPYTAAQIVRQGSVSHLYDLHLQKSLESRIAPGDRFLPFDHPPFEAWLYVPLGSLSYTQAYVLWSAFNLLVLGLALFFVPKLRYRLDADSRLLWLATCLPIVAGALVLGQDSLLLVPVFLFGFLALKKRREVTAGLVLGAGLFRFEILLPFLFVFFLRRRWKVLAGFSVAGLVALLASVAMVGWDGLGWYLKVLLTMGQTSAHGENEVFVSTMPSLRGALVTFSGGAIPYAWLFPLVLAGTLALLGWAAWEFHDIARPESREFDLQFSFAVIAALLCSYSLYAHELTPLVVVAFLLLGYEGVAHRSEALLRRPGALLLLLFFLVLMGGEMIGFRSFSVVFVILLGLLLWLSQEIAFLRKVPASG